MRNKNAKNAGKGFTLIELIVTIGLLTMILLIAFNMQVFGNRIYYKGETRADIQSKLRVNSAVISDLIRYASNVKILAAVPATFDSTKHYIYSDGGVLKHYVGGVSTKLSGDLNGIASTLYFEDQDSQTVQFKISGSDKGESFDIQSSVFMLNVGSGGLPETTGTAIEFTAGVPVNSNINANPVETITVNTIPAGTLTVNKSGTLDFAATVLPNEASINTVRWSVKVDGALVDTTIANIISTGDREGRLQLNNAPVGAIVTVKASAMDDSGIDAEKTVTVNDTPAVAVSTITVRSMPTDRTPEYIFKQSGLLQLDAYITPTDATDKSVTWSLKKTDGSAVPSTTATIDSGGLLKTASTNTSNEDIVVTATSNSSGKTSSKTIKMVTNIPANGISTYVDTGGGLGTVYGYLKIYPYPYVSLSTGVKAIQYSKNGSSLVTVTTNPFTIALKNNDSLIVVFKLISGDDIIVRAQ